MNNNSGNFLYQRYIKSYVVVFKGTKEVRYLLFIKQNILCYFFPLGSNLKGNQQWKNLKAAGDDANIEKEIHRMTLEHKLKQPQTLFTVWARQSTTSTNSTHDSISIMNSVVTETNTTRKTDDTNTSSASNSSSSNKLSNRPAVNYFS